MQRFLYKNLFAMKKRSIFAIRKIKQKESEKKKKNSFGVHS